MIYCRGISPGVCAFCGNSPRNILIYCRNVVKEGFIHALISKGLRRRRIARSVASNCFIHALISKGLRPPSSALLRNVRLEHLIERTPDAAGLWPSWLHVPLPTNPLACIPMRRCPVKRLHRLTFCKERFDSIGGRVRPTVKGQLPMALP